MIERMTEERFRELHERIYGVKTSAPATPKEQREVVDELWSMRLLAKAQKEYIHELLSALDNKIKELEP